MLKLDESRGDGRDVALLVAESDASCAFGILELGIGIYTGVADTAVESVHDHGQLESLEWSWHTADEDGFARVEWHRGVENVVRVAESPGPDLYRLVLDRR